MLSRNCWLHYAMSAMMGLIVNVCGATCGEMHGAWNQKIIILSVSFLRSSCPYSGCTFSLFDVGCGCQLLMIWQFRTIFWTFSDAVRWREFPSRFLLHTLVGGAAAKIYAPTQQRNLSGLRTLLEGRDFFRRIVFQKPLRQSFNVVVCWIHLSFEVELSRPAFFCAAFCPSCWVSLFDSYHTHARRCCSAWLFGTAVGAVLEKKCNSVNYWE